MSDDELRRRLQELPGPGSGLDVDAVVAGAKRRRRPKVAALNAAAAGVGVLVIAPFVVPGFSPIAPSSMEQGAGQPAAPAQESGEDAAGSTEAGSAGSDSLPLACTYPALVDETGVRAAFLDDPADGIADLELTPALPPELRILGVAVAQVAADGDALTIIAAPDLEALEDAPPVGVSEEIARVDPASTVYRDGAVLDAPDVDCGVDAPSVPAPLLLVELEGRRIAVVGEPFDVR
ncbi:MAG: hypothetical protein ACQEWM_01445 [Actinomycetota bacterium]